MKTPYEKEIDSAWIKSLIRKMSQEFPKASNDDTTALGGLLGQSYSAFDFAELPHDIRGLLARFKAYKEQVNAQSSRSCNAANDKVSSAEGSKPTTFAPLEAVLVKNNTRDPWRVDLFRYHEGKLYACFTGMYQYCIPWYGNQDIINQAGN